MFGWLNDEDLEDLYYEQAAFFRHDRLTTLIFEQETMLCIMKNSLTHNPQ